ncbi:hypothetical protein IFT77_15795, partial [Frigoribacterium sp. CFBP 13729]|nr:hypothetical protein [Frigoribacterium sp. CFBP 13729]
MNISRKTITKSAFGIVASGALIFSLAACSSGDAGSTSSSSAAPSSSSSAAPTEPVASLPDLSKGVDTQVAVDASFVEALTS